MSTKQKWIKNLLVAHVVMTEMPDESIYRNLAIYCDDRHDCGSPACFGGWVGRIPYFQKQGIVVDEGSGAPYLTTKGVIRHDIDSSIHLFGDFLFSARSYEERYEIGKDKTDRGVILHRIETQIENLLSN